MAIIQAKRVTIIGHKHDKPRILKTLQGLGAVQVEQNPYEEADSVETSQAITDLEKKLADIRFAHDLLRPYDDTKKPMLGLKPTIDEDGLDGLQALERKCSAAVESIKEYAEEMSWANANMMRSKNLMLQVEPYLNFDETFDALGKNIYTFATVGMIPPAQMPDFESLMEDLSGESYYEVIDETSEAAVVFCVVHLDVLDQFKEGIKLLGYNEAKYTQFEASPKGIIEQEKSDIAEMKAKKDEIKQELKAYIPYIQDLESLEDYYSAALQREKAALRFGYTKNAFILEGWINEHTEGEVAAAVEKVSPDAYISFRYPEDGETYPTIIENKSVTRPFEAITSMYDTPSAKGIDPNNVMAPFFIITFGMMMSDAGYGIILALACSLVLLITKKKGMFGKILGVVAIGGISTLAWGLLFGGWFGINVEPLWFNPLSEPLMMLGLCLGLGAFQLIVGLIVAARMNIRRGKPWAALFDQVSWILLLLGLPSLLLGGTIAVVGKYMSFAGAGLLVIFGGRNKKGIIGKIIGGFSSIYGITGYLSDILSYSRIFGMGLATGVIAMVFNTIAGMMWGKLYGVGAVLAIIILAVGHGFNIAINTLGAYVHSCRLQYIEFYDKFFEGGGVPFRPLKVNIKHYRFEK